MFVKRGWLVKYRYFYTLNFYGRHRDIFAIFDHFGATNNETEECTYLAVL